MKPTLVVLAAGMGSRFGGLKQIEPIGPNGEWILDFSVYDAVQANFGKVVFVIRREMEKAFIPVRQRYEQSIEVVFAFQEQGDVPQNISSVCEREKPWGTGHAVYAARNALTEPFSVINADDFYGREAFEALSRFLRQGSLDTFALVGYHLVNTLSKHGTVSRGICKADYCENLIKVEEHREIGYTESGQRIEGLNTAGERIVLDQNAVASMNCWGFPTSFLPKLESLLEAFLEKNGSDPKFEFYLPFAVDELIQKGEASCRVLTCSAKWLGITHRDDLQNAREELQALFEQGEYPSSLWD